VDCEFEKNFDAECSVRCGRGIKKFSIRITKPSSNGGKACPTELKGTEPCDGQYCPVPCSSRKINTWGTEYDACGGLRHQALEHCNRKNWWGQPDPDGRWVYDAFWDSRNAHGRDCGNSQDNYKGNTWDNSCGKIRNSKAGEEYDALNCRPKPTDCSFVKTYESECSARCGKGERDYSIRINKQPSWGGAACPVTLKGKESCDGQYCPVNCAYRKKFGECSKKCGPGGTKQWVLEITQQPKYGGQECPAQKDMGGTVECNEGVCEPIDCNWEAIYGGCSQTCPPTKNWAVKINSYPEHGGRGCPTQLTGWEYCTVQNSGQEQMSHCCKVTGKLVDNRNLDANRQCCTGLFDYHPNYNNRGTPPYLNEGYQMMVCK